MYQTVIRDPGGDGLVRIVPCMGDQFHTVVNGSLLVVPAGTVAIVSVNGVLSEPYRPRQQAYRLSTGEDPFFVRMRHVMTHGDAGISVSVFYISTEVNRFLRFGSGELPFQEKRFRITMKAFATVGLTLSVAEPKTFLEKLVGSYRGSFTQDELEPCLEQLLLAPVRETLSRALGQLEVTEFNGNLQKLSVQLTPGLQQAFGAYGLKLHRCQLLAVNVPQEEIQRLYTLEQTAAQGRIRTDIEEDVLNRIYGGSLDRRTLTELMTGIPARGGEGGGNPGPGAAGMGPMMTQMLLLGQLLPSLREPITSMAQHTDLFGGNPAQPQENGTAPASPPPMPSRSRRCPACSGSIPRNCRICPICGSTV